MYGPGYPGRIGETDVRLVSRQDPVRRDLQRKDNRMPGPQFFTPGAVRPSRPKRRFTLQEANNSLSLVKRVVNDIVNTHANVTSLQARLDRTTAREQQSLQTDLDLAVTRLEDFVDELTEIGCELKDYEAGLVDFIGRHRGRDVYLCWKLGEDKIGYWHELGAGFAGRQPIGTLVEG